MTASEQLLATARQVATDEARALEALAESFDERFVEAANLVLAATGRIIISGIGKSGHIGRKIAATLASTGTPAYFVHPAEAKPWRPGYVIQRRCGCRNLQLRRSAGTGKLVGLYPPL